MIERIDIKGYKTIREQEVELGPINVLIGGNGVGKSNFISIFSLFRAIYEGNLSAYVLRKGGADSFLYFGKKHTKEISFDFHFLKDSKKNRFIISLANNQDSLFINSVDTAYQNMEWEYTQHEKNVKESSLRTLSNANGQALMVKELLKEFEVYHFHDTSDESAIKSHSNIDDNRVLRKDGSNIAAFLYYSKRVHPKHFWRIEKTVNSATPFFDRFVLEPSNHNENLIKLEWKERGNYDSYFDAYSLSDGTLRFICLTTLLMQPCPAKTIIIDEPELGLHPVAINKLAGLIRKISGNTQIIMSTQSLNLVDNFDPQDIIVADREDNQTVFNRLDNESLRSWLDDYSLGDVWGKNVFGGQPF